MEIFYRFCRIRPEDCLKLIFFIEISFKFEENSDSKLLNSLFISSFSVFFAFVIENIWKLINYSIYFLFRSWSLIICMFIEFKGHWVLCWLLTAMRFI